MRQHPVITRKLAVEPHLVAQNQFGEVIIGDGAKIQQVTGVARLAVFKHVTEVGGFGADDTPRAPEAVGDFENKLFLEFADGPEFVEEGDHDIFIFFGVLFQAGRVDNDVFGVKTMSGGIMARGRFAFISFRPGRFFAAFAIGGLLFFGYQHDVLPTKQVGGRQPATAGPRLPPYFRFLFKEKAGNQQ